MRRGLALLALLLAAGVLLAACGADDEGAIDDDTVTVPVDTDAETEIDGVDTETGAVDTGVVDTDGDLSAQADSIRSLLERTLQDLQGVSSVDELETTLSQAATDFEAAADDVAEAAPDPGTEAERLETSLRDLAADLEGVAADAGSAGVEDLPDLLQRAVSVAEGSLDDVTSALDAAVAEAGGS